jgi:hypothetical protein
VVIGQADTEAPGELALRGIHRIASIESGGERIRRALVLIAPRIDEQSMAARDLLARAVLTHGSRGPLELVFEACSEWEIPLRAWLLALAGKLMADPRALLTPIVLRFR